MSPDVLLRAVANLIPLILSLTVHEFAHAWTAHKLGDDTAERMGRLTLNPVPHIDPIGTILMPLAAALFPGMMLFGWAKPVPVNPARFDRRFSMRTGDVLVSAAGPLSNVVLAVLGSVAYGLLGRFAPDTLARPGVEQLLGTVIVLNVTLAIFNLIPVPPLDGSHVVGNLLPRRLQGAWESFAALGPFLLLAVFVFGARIIAVPHGYAIGLLNQLINAIGA